MTNKELHKLNRSELLELLLEQSREVDLLKERLADMEKRLKDREIAIQKAGSIAEASLVLNHIFTDAQKAADLYLENVKRISKGCDGDK